MTHALNRPFPTAASNRARALALLLGSLFLCHCSAPISVSVVKPGPPPNAVASGSPACLLENIRENSGRIARGDASAVAAYNHSVARLLESLEASGAKVWDGPVKFSDSSGTFVLTGKAPAGIRPGTGKLYPTDTLRFSGKYGDTRAAFSGIGAPLVYVKSFTGIGHMEIRANLPVRDFTAIVRFSGNRAELELLDPFQTETTDFAGRSRVLSADYGSAMQLVLSKVRIEKLGIVRLLHPSRYDNTANLNFTQAYDPKRIPVLMVHGLDSTPATWAPMYFQLMKDPVIRRNYQFWVFSYPSGYPYPYSAALLRRELDEVKREYPGHKPIVIMGHSMGGLITRLMLTDAGDRLWMKGFGKPPASTPIVGNSRKLLEEVLIFDNRKEINRAMFFSAPHRGSDLAVNPIGRLFARLVKMPGLLADVRNAALSLATADAAGLMIESAPNSIGTLSPRNPYVLAVNEIPIAKGVPYHSVVGDRGKGDTPDSSDGVVPYWSSHLEGAVSEKIVPSGHGSHVHPEGIAEAHRILLLHLKNKP